MLLLAAAFVFPVTAQVPPQAPASMAATPEELDQGLATLWEVLWHQSGIATRVVRWDTDIRMRISGANAGAHRETLVRAMRAVTQEAGVRLVDVTDTPGEAANLSIEITADHSLEDNQPCVTMLDFNRAETRIEQATMQLRNRDAWRCAHHEAMHVMGLRGHPAGKTVLSYFPWKVDALLPLDKVMLRAWYSPRMAPGATPFEALSVLADELVLAQADKTAASAARDRFFNGTLEQMQAFAGGRGDVPVILKRSGKTTDDGIRSGRSAMGYYLGVAYQTGVVASQDLPQARRWYEQAASTGNRAAQTRLGSFR